MWFVMNQMWLGNSIVVGSTTAGGATQRVGIVPDVVVQPTVEGIAGAK
jgi:hypothetical protein